jgi:uncharacterized membrane protein YhaH (DUF805 family)
MGFVEATKSGFRNYVNFKGRASRSEYWYFVLATILGSIVFGIIDGLVFGMGSAELTSGDGVGFAYSAGVLGTIWSLAVLLPSIAVGIRRMHDIDRSGWWILIGLVPLVGWIIWIYFCVTKGTEGPNRFGSLGGVDAEQVFG